MTVEEIRERVRGLIAGLARIDGDFSPDADVFRELGLESHAALDLVLQMEETFDIAVDDETFGNTRTLQQMTQLVASLRGVSA